MYVLTVNKATSMSDSKIALEELLYGDEPDQFQATQIHSEILDSDADESEIRLLNVDEDIDSVYTDQEDNPSNESTCENNPETQDNNESVQPVPADSIQHFNVILTNLLPNRIPEATLQATDKLKPMLTSTVQDKIRLYAKTGKVSVKKLQLSFPDSYTSKLKNDKSLIESIYTPIFEMIETIDDLVLPELSIDTLHHLLVVQKVLHGTRKCSAISIPFSAENATEIENLLPTIVNALMPLNPSYIDCKPNSESARHINIKGKSCPLKQNLTTKTSANKSLTFIYDGHKIQKGTSESRKRARSLVDHDLPHAKKGAKASEKEKKIKPKKPRKLLAIRKCKESLYTFDSIEPQQDLTDLSFTAVSYWQLDKIHKNEIYQGRETTIAVVDGGFDSSHPAFNDGRLIHFQDFAINNMNPEGSSHGTLCTGIACGKTFLYPASPGEVTSQLKVFPSGVAPGAKYIICKIVMHGKIEAYEKSILQALEWIRDYCGVIDVVSLSLGSLKFSPEIAQVITGLVNKNIIVVCAASNHGHKFSQPICFPARLGSVLCIGSHGPHGKPSPFSPVGQQIDFLAPGEKVAGPSSALFNHHVIVDSGTSYAAPAVAGLICLILGYIKHNHPDHLHVFKNHWVMKEVLREISICPGRHSEYQGYGSLNPMRFFQQPELILNSVITDVINRPE